MNSENKETFNKNYSIKMLDLIQVWSNEKLSDDLLPYETKKIEEIITLIEKKEEELKKNNYEKDLKYYIELDIERIKYIIKDYLRIRLMKIEKYLFYIIKENKVNIVNSNEMNFIVDLINYKSSYFNQNLKQLSGLVNNFYVFTEPKKTLKEKIAMINNDMIVAPPKNFYVIIENISNQTLVYNLKNIYDGASNEESIITINTNDKYLIPYKLIESDLLNNKVKLI